MSGASMSDMRAILPLSTPSAAGPSKPPPKKPGPKKPEGISREVYSLMGGSLPPLAAQVAKPRLKQKPNLGGGGKVKWEWRKFKNGARKDGLHLGHWVKANSDPNAEYAFAKYNIQNTDYTYSQDEYSRLLEDREWTKEETDYLFERVKEYDLRWHIIADRYDYPGGKTRTMEDMKDRYFSVCRKLIRNRPWPGDDFSKNRLIASFAFDKDRETMRKNYLLSLESRTPAQIAEEEALYIELKKIEQNERVFRRERDELLRNLLGVDSGLADLPIEDESGPAAASAIDNKSGAPEISSTRKSTKRRGTGISLADLGNGVGGESPASPASAGPSAMTPRSRQPSTKSSAYDIQHCITRIEADKSATAALNKQAHQAATLRTFKIPYPKSALAGKVNQVLVELGLTPARLVMPTRETLAAYEQLLGAATSLVETKKVADTVDQEIKIMKARLGMKFDAETSSGSAAAGMTTSLPAGANGEARSSVVPGGEEVGAVGSSHQQRHTTQTPAPMDLDLNDDDVKMEDEDERDGERAQSVVSTRSARSSRRQAQGRRSRSISSVDTTATRSGNKRQRQ